MCAYTVRILSFFIHMKTLYHILRFLFGVLLLMPMAGAFGLLPPPTEDMYTSSEAWIYMEALMNTGFIMPAIGVIALACAILLFINRTALAAVLLAPFTVNVMLFHIFLDEAPISANAIPAYLLLALNAYFLWYNWSKYKPMWSK